MRPQAGRHDGATPRDCPLHGIPALSVRCLLSPSHSHSPQSPSPRLDNAMMGALSRGLPSARNSSPLRQVLALPVPQSQPPSPRPPVPFPSPQGRQGHDGALVSRGLPSARTSSPHLQVLALPVPHPHFPAPRLDNAMMVLCPGHCPLQGLPALPFRCLPSPAPSPTPHPQPSDPIPQPPD